MIFIASKLNNSFAQFVLISGIKVFWSRVDGFVAWLRLTNMDMVRPRLHRPSDDPFHRGWWIFTQKWSASPWCVWRRTRRTHRLGLVSILIHANSGIRHRIDIRQGEHNCTSLSQQKFGWPFAGPIDLRREESICSLPFPGGGFMMQLATSDDDDDDDDETTNERKQHRNKIDVRRLT